MRRLLWVNLVLFGISIGVLLSWACGNGGPLVSDARAADASTATPVACRVWQVKVEKITGAGSNLVRSTDGWEPFNATYVDWDESGADGSARDVMQVYYRRCAD